MISPAARAPNPDGPWLSVVVPCYNEGEIVGETHRRIADVCARIGRTHEIVIVDDGSTDDTWEKLGRMSRADPRLIAVKLSRNHGHQLALSAGLNFARGERVLLMDADLQDPPELLPEMLARMDEGLDVVYAQRRSRPGDAALKRFFCAVYYRVLRRVAETQIPLDTGDFRLISRRVRDLLVAMPERQRFIRGMVSWVGFRQGPILYDRDARLAGTTKYPLRKLIRLAVDGIISSSLRPLAFASVIGSVAIGLGILLGAYALVSWLFAGETPRGWTSIVLAVVLLGGAQLLVLGILGEYVGRIYDQTRGRPMFLVESVVQGNTGSTSESVKSAAVKGA